MQRYDIKVYKMINDVPLKAMAKVEEGFYVLYADAQDEREQLLEACKRKDIVIGELVSCFELEGKPLTTYYKKTLAKAKRELNREEI